MVRKFIFSIGLLFIITIISISTLPSMAAPQSQEGDQPDRLRPDQYSYHGEEELPFLPSSEPPEIESNAISSPVEGWSKIAFKSYVDGAGWEIYFASGSFTNLVRLTNNGSYDIHPRLNRGTTRIAFASRPYRYLRDLHHENGWNEPDPLDE